MKIPINHEFWIYLDKDGEVLLTPDGKAYMRKCKPTQGNVQTCGYSYKKNVRSVKCIIVPIEEGFKA